MIVESSWMLLESVYTLFLTRDAFQFKFLKMFLSFHFLFFVLGLVLRSLLAYFFAWVMFGSACRIWGL